MRKLAAIYRRKGMLFVSAAHRTEAGFWIDDEYVISLDQPTYSAIGRAIEQALARSKDGVPTPPPTARIDKPLLKAAGVGSWATFMKLSQHIGVSSEDGVVTITPYRNLGGKGGFEPQTRIPVDHDVSSSTLGQMVVDLLSAET